TITVDAGTYPELVNVDKTLMILGAQSGIDARSAARGAAESIVRGADLGGGKRSSGFRVTANNVTIDGFTVQDTTAGSYGAGIVLGPGTYGSRILNNRIRNNAVGIYLANSGPAVPTM